MPDRETYQSATGGHLLWQPLGRDLAYFDVPGHQWKAGAGQYEIEVGASSRDIRQKSSLQLDKVFTQSIEPHIQ